MTLMKKITIFAAVACLSLVFVGCGGANKIKKQDFGKVKSAKSTMPPEIDKLIRKKFKHSVVAVGVATHPANDETAMKKARLQADMKLAQQFENQVSSLQKSFLEDVNGKSIDHFQETVESFTNIKIQGARSEKELVTEGKDGYKAYVLKVVSAEVLKELIEQKTNALTEFKALKAYNELEERVRLDNESRRSE